MTSSGTAAVAAGELHADVHGSKLRGRLLLVRRGDAGGNGKEQWLLPHKRDEPPVAPGATPEKLAALDDCDPEGRLYQHLHAENE